MIIFNNQSHKKIKTPMEREREREGWYRKKPIQSNKEQIKKKPTSISNR